MKMAGTTFYNFGDLSGASQSIENLSITRTSTSTINEPMQPWESALAAYQAEREAYLKAKQGRVDNPLDRAEEPSDFILLQLLSQN